MNDMRDAAQSETRELWWGLTPRFILGSVLIVRAVSGGWPSGSASRFTKKTYEIPNMLPIREFFTRTVVIFRRSIFGCLLADATHRGIQTGTTNEAFEIPCNPK